MPSLSLLQDAARAAAAGAAAARICSAAHLCPEEHCQLTYFDQSESNPAAVPNALPTQGRLSYNTRLYKSYRNEPMCFRQGIEDREKNLRFTTTRPGFYP